MEKFTIGSDISKDKINFAVRWFNEVILEKEVENKTQALNKFIKEVMSLGKRLAKEKGAQFSLVFVMEYTGIYNALLIECLVGHNLTTYVISGLEIKNSLGINRGKNDKIDARRIAEYGVRFADKLKPYNLPGPSLVELKALNTKRSQLVKAKTQLSQSDGDTKKFQGRKIHKKLNTFTNPVVKELETAIKLIEEEMLEIVKSDEDIFENYNLAISVPGVGKMTAIAFICATTNFTKFESAKALGSYCGVVPFGKESGRYKGKDRVSHIANKKLKTLLHLGAMSVIGRKNPFAIYYHRKVSEDKKNKMLVINNVSNKIVKTLFACITKRIKYKFDYSYEFAA